MKRSVFGAALPLVAPEEADRVRALAREVLERPEYEGARGSIVPDPLLELLRMIGPWLDRIGLLRVESPPLYWAIIIGLTLLAGLLITHMVWSISRSVQDSAESPSRSRRLPAVDLATGAREHAGAGRYLEAAHQLLLATLQRVVRAGVVELGPGDTNREVCRRVLASSLPEALRGELVALVRATERAWFRDRRGDADLYDRWSRAYAQLEEHTRGDA